MTTMTLNPPRSGGMTSEERLVIFASSLGTVFEWYDFYIYGTLGVFLAKYFFSNVPANVGFIFALLAFAAGFAVRPFGALIFGRRHQGGEVDFRSLLIPYLVLAVVVLVVIAVFSRVQLPELEGGSSGAASAVEEAAHAAPLQRQPHFTLGIVTQFLYIAAQVGVNAFAVNYILSNAITRDASGATLVDPRFAWYRALTGAATPEATAAYVVTIAMVLYALGRFSGAAIARVIRPNLLLSLYGVANCLIVLVVMADLKQFSWLVLPFCWLFMSIMFPFIFAMSLRNLGARTKLAASFQIMSIVGGAIAPPLMGFLADTYHNMAICFIVPLVGFLAPTLYGLFYPRLLRRSAAAV